MQMATQAKVLASMALQGGVRLRRERPHAGRPLQHLLRQNSAVLTVLVLRYLNKTKTYCLYVLIWQHRTYFHWFLFWSWFAHGSQLCWWSFKELRGFVKGFSSRYSWWCVMGLSIVFDLFIVFDLVTSILQPSSLAMRCTLYGPSSGGFSRGCDLLCRCSAGLCTRQLRLGMHSSLSRGKRVRARVSRRLLAGQHITFTSKTTFSVLSNWNGNPCCTEMTDFLSSWSSKYNWYKVHRYLLLHTFLYK